MIESTHVHASFVYGAPDRTSRKLVWDLLSFKHVDPEKPWLLIGDFNDLIDNSEKEGGTIRPEGTFCDFRSFLSSNDLYDLQHTGNSLSWRGIRHSHTILYRLDRVLTNCVWAERFPSSFCQYLNFEGSDHRPIITRLEPQKKRKGGLFCYDRSLRENKEIKALVASSSWYSNRPCLVKDRIDKCRTNISAWMKENHQNSQEVIQSLKRKLEEVMSSPKGSEEEIQNFNYELKAAYHKEEQFWKQRSRVLWLSLGDKNSSFFHSTTRGRRAINNLSTIDDEENISYQEENQILRVISNCFQNLFASQGITQFDCIEDTIQQSITQEQNEQLTTEHTLDEVREALFSIHPDRAPGPDGFSSCFFQSNWGVVGPAISREIIHFFRTGILPSAINQTHVRFIPKNQGARKVADYRPIALCNVYYKIISKLLTRRLQPILHLLISENQSAFVPGRAISDNVLITHEVQHYLKKSKAKKYSSMAVKTNMSKTYDIIEWNFIEFVLSKFGFHPRMVQWIMQCITTVTYSFLLNGTAQGYVKPSRGVRQGDPLSPYIFILCSEVLSGLCNKAQREGMLVGIRLAKESRRVNHLLFAYDNMFFTKAAKKSCEALHDILLTYESVSGQKINVAKSSITFSSKASLDIKEQAKDILDIRKEGG